MITRCRALHKVVPVREARALEYIKQPLTTCSDRVEKHQFLARKRSWAARNHCMRPTSTDQIAQTFSFLGKVAPRFQKTRPAKLLLHTRFCGKPLQGCNHQFNATQLSDLHLSPRDPRKARGIRERDPGGHPASCLGSMGRTDLNVPSSGRKSPGWQGVHVEPCVGAHVSCFGRISCAERSAPCAGSESRSPCGCPFSEGGLNYSIRNWHTIYRTQLDRLIEKNTFGLLGKCII